MRLTRPHDWVVVRRKADGLRSVDDVALFFRELARIADDEFRRLGVAPGTGTSLTRLRPYAAADIRSVVRMSENVGAKDFRALLDQYETDSGLRGDQSFTPASLCRLMAKLVEPSSGVSVYDPYARSGELLVAAAVEMDVAQVRGESPDPNMIRVLAVNLLLQGRAAELCTTRSAPWERSEPWRADVILCNPPFNGGLPTEKSEWPFGPSPSSNNNLAWDQYIVSCLNPNGLAVVVMPNNAAVSANPREREIRRQLVAAGVVHCVILLPARMFAMTAVPVSIWVLGRRNRGQVLFVDARRKGTHAGGRRVLTEQDIAEIVGAVQEWRATGSCTSEFSTAVPIDQISGPDYSLSPTDYVATAGAVDPTADTAAGTG